MMSFGFGAANGPTVPPFDKVHIWLTDGITTGTGKIKEL